MTKGVTVAERETYIWGAAKHGAYAFEQYKDKFRIQSFIDQRANTEFNEFCGKPVITPEQFFQKNKSLNIQIIIAVRYPAEVIKLMENSSLALELYIFDGRDKENSLLYQVNDGEICIPEYMDKRFSEWEEYAWHYSKLNPFVLKMFRTSLEWVKTQKKEIKICEIGCGSGQFANMLFDQGYLHYVGVDFSNQAIMLAKKANHSYWDRFICVDAFSFLEEYKENKFTLFIAFEVLEHINKDIELLNMLPKGVNVIFSVPNFKSFNHIRTFDTLEQIKNRYKMLDILDYKKNPANNKGDKFYHLVFAKTVLF